MFASSIISSLGISAPWVIELIAVIQINVIAIYYVLMEALYTRLPAPSAPRKSTAPKKVAVLTGACGALGQEFVRLLSAEYRIVALCQSAERGRRVLARLGVADLLLLECDLRELRQTRHAAAAIKAHASQVDLVICNAGVLHPASSFAAADSITTNVLSHALLMQDLLPICSSAAQFLLISSCCSHAAFIRDDDLTSPASTLLREAAGPYQAYALSKLLLAVYGEEFASQHPEYRVVAAHPGIFASGLYKRTNFLYRLIMENVAPVVMTSPRKAAALCLDAVKAEHIANGSYVELGRKVTLQPGLSSQDMVSVKKGVLVTCDPALRQLLVHLDDTRELGSKFIIKELDDRHLLIDRDIVKDLEVRLEQFMEQQNPDLGEK